MYVYGHWPEKEIDHINCVKDDNRIANLRIATRGDNCHNSSKPRNNTSGFKGVDYHKHTKKWRARITVNDGQISLGYYHTPEEAHQAYCRKAKELFGEFARFE